MKIAFAEKICKIVGGYYESFYSGCGTILFIDICTGNNIIFDDDLKKVRRLLKRNKAHIQYINIKHDKLVINCVLCP